MDIVDIMSCGSSTIRRVNSFSKTRVKDQIKQCKSLKIYNYVSPTCLCLPHLWEGDICLGFLLGVRSVHTLHARLRKKYLGFSHFDIGCPRPLSWIYQLLATMALHVFSSSWHACMIVYKILNRWFSNLVIWCPRTVSWLYQLLVTLPLFLRCKISCKVFTWYLSNLDILCPHRCVKVKLGKCFVFTENICK